MAVLGAGRPEGPIGQSAITIHLGGGAGPGLAGHPFNGYLAEGPEAADGWELDLTPQEKEHLLIALTRLTPREREVACAICLGGANEAVADRLCIALPTLRTHLMRINQKLGTTSKSDLVRFVSASLLEGYRRGEISAPRPASIAEGKIFGVGGVGSTSRGPRPRIAGVESESA